MIDIKRNLKAILEERGIMQKQVAQGLGISDQAVSNWFNSPKDVKVSRITQMCEVFHIPVVDVFTYPEKYIPENQANPACEECRRKDEIIENLTELLRIYKTEAKKKR
jgi:transcriptional regulator with XRE-family HTH domain